MMESCTPGTEILHLHRFPKLGFKSLPGRCNVAYDAWRVDTRASRQTTAEDVVVEAWLRYDQVVGKKVIFWLGRYNDGDKWMYERDVRSHEANIVSHFKNQFAGRIVEEKEKRIRIKINDSSKHILMRILEEEDNYGILVTATWQVIRADLAEEQYDKKSGYVYVEC